jgi:hypothetical protein
MIDVCDIMDVSSDYALFIVELREEKLEEINEKTSNFTEKEIKAGLSVIVSGISGIIRSLRYADNASEYLTAIPSIIENIYNKDKQQYAAKNITHDYDDISAFINKDGTKVAKKLFRVKIPEEKMPEYLEIMHKAAKECIDICLDKFRADISEYQSKKRVSWANKVTKITADSQGQEITTTTETIKDNQGNRQKWKESIKLNSENVQPSVSI